MGERTATCWTTPSPSANGAPAYPPPFFQIFLDGRADSYVRNPTTPPGECPPRLSTAASTTIGSHTFTMRCESVLRQSPFTTTTTENFEPVSVNVNGPALST